MRKIVNISKIECVKVDDEYADTSQLDQEGLEALENGDLGYAGIYAECEVTTISR